MPQPPVVIPAIFFPMSDICGARVNLHVSDSSNDDRTRLMPDRMPVLPGSEVHARL